MEIIQASAAVVGSAIVLEYQERRVGDPHILVADNTAIKAAMGWAPKYSDLETILSSAWHWHSSHPNGYRQ